MRCRQPGPRRRRSSAQKFAVTATTLRERPAFAQHVIQGPSQLAAAGSDDMAVLHQPPQGSFPRKSGWPFRTHKTKRSLKSCWTMTPDPWGRSLPRRGVCGRPPQGLHVLLALAKKADRHARHSSRTACSRQGARTPAKASFTRILKTWFRVRRSGTASGRRISVASLTKVLTRPRTASARCGRHQAPARPDKDWIVHRLADSGEHVAHCRHAQTHCAGGNRHASLSV